MEHRLILTNQEAFELSNKLNFISTEYLKDEYTGTKRIRTDRTGIREKEYPTPVTGTIHKFTSLCSLGDIENIWFEYKWTDKTQRFEIEFEGEVPPEYRDRENIKGWEILV